MIRLFISFLFSIWSLCLFAEEQYILRVWLSDKEECEFSLLHPEEFLSQRAIERHKRDDIVFSVCDLPVSKLYRERVMSVAKREVCHSNWLNTLVVECDSAKVGEIEFMPFVERIEILSKGDDIRKSTKSDFYNFGDINLHPLYGVAQPLSKSADVTRMHKKGHWGNGVFIAVLDDGFGGVDTLNQWFDLNRIKFTCDVVNPEGDIYSEDDHGTAVLSIMLANRKGEFVGVAPESDYALIRTEDISIETPYEEDFFVRGLEIADSIGVDIVNVSLGYEQVGDITAVSCIASEIASNKGIVIVSSCGNKGNAGFTHPADANGVIAVGGVDKRGRLADFTSKEFIRGKYVAPKKRALAEDVPIIDGSGKIMSAYGTSFAAPAVTGAIAIKKSY